MNKLEQAPQGEQNERLTNENRADNYPAVEVISNHEEIDDGIDVESLIHKDKELLALRELLSGIRNGIANLGLQTVVDLYGAEKFVETLSSKDVNTFKDALKELAPSKNERKELYSAIESEPIESVAGRFNEEFGGIPGELGNVSTGAMKNHREITLAGLRDENVAADYVMGADYLVVNAESLNKYPDVVQNFLETNDVFVLLKDLRDIYGTEKDRLVESTEATKEKIEGLVAAEEEIIREQQALADDIHRDEILALEGRLEGLSESSADMVLGMLEEKVKDVNDFRSKLASKMNGARQRVISGLGAESVYEIDPSSDVMNVAPIYDEQTGKKIELTW